MVTSSSVAKVGETPYSRVASLGEFSLPMSVRCTPCLPMPHGTMPVSMKCRVSLPQHLACSRTFIMFNLRVVVHVVCWWWY